MEALELVDCVERIREHCLGKLPQLAQRLRELRANDYRQKPNAFFMTRLLALACRLDEHVPAHKRQLHRLVHQSPLAHFFALPPEDVQEPTEPECAPVSDETASEEPLPEAFLRLAEKSLSVFGSCHEDSFASRLGQCHNLQEAQKLIRKAIPLLSSRQGFTYLREVGYPSFEPRAETRRLLFRLGVVKLQGGSQEAMLEFFSQMENLARLSCLCAAELDLLLGLFAGGLGEKGFEPLCSRQPRCAHCCVTAHCAHFRFHGLPAQGESRPIPSWAADERPRERLASGENLNATELLAIILRTGSSGQSAIELASKLRQAFGSLHRLADATPGQIARLGIKGIGLAKATQIKAAIELGKRIAAPENDEREGLRQVCSSRDVFDIYRPVFKNMTQEQFLLLVLNTKNRITRQITVSTGTLNSSIVHPRDVFKPALQEAAAAVIFVHNHPSGDPAPSGEDRALTTRLVEAGRLLGIKVLDHIVIGSQRYYSFADEGELK